MPIKPKKEKGDKPSNKVKKESVDSGPNAETMLKTGFGPARKTKLIGGFAYQWYDAKHEVVRIDFAAEDASGGWATISFGPIGGSEKQMRLLTNLIKKNGDKLLDLARATDSKTFNIKSKSKTVDKPVTKSSPAKAPKDDLEKLFSDNNPLLRRKRKAK